jgi:outer membrane protein assembly factor BamA
VRCLTLLGHLALALALALALPGHPSAHAAPSKRAATPSGVASPCQEALLSERGFFERKGGGWRYVGAPTSGASPRAEASPHLDDWRGRLVTRVDLECALQRCAEDPNLHYIIQQTLRVPSWQPLIEDTLVGAWRRLLQTGLFRPDSYVIFKHDPDAPYVELRFCARGATVVRRLDIRYDPPSSALYPKQFIGEVRKRLDIKKGGVFPNDDAFARAQEAQVRTLYERLGYEGTRVRIRPHYLDRRGELVDIDVVISEGQRPLLSPPLVRTRGALSYAEVAQAIVPDTFFDIIPDLFGIFGLGRYDRRAIRERVEALERRLRERGYFTARVRAVGEELSREAVGVTVRPVIDVERGPLTRVRFVGNANLSEAELSEELTFSESGAVDEVEVEQSRLRIEGRYRSIAHYYARVRAQVAQHLAVEEGDEERVDVTFFVDEGPQVYVGEVIVKGAQHLSAETVREQMLIKGVAPNGVLNLLSASAGVLQDAALNQDLERVLKRYRAEGYSRAVLRCSDPKREPPAQWRKRLARQAQGLRDEGSFDVWTHEVSKYTCFEVLPDTSKRAERRFLKVRFTLDEGERTSLNRLDISPFLEAMDEVTRDDAQRVLRALGFFDELGDPIPSAGLSAEKLEVVKGIVLRSLQQAGHLNASVSPLCQMLLSDKTLSAPAPCDLEERYGQEIERLTLKATLGPRAEVEGIILRGNLLTEPSVIRREVLLSAGRPLSSEALLLSQSNLRGLGLFRAVSIESVGLGEAPEGSRLEPVTMVVSVEENPPWQADALLGLVLKDSPLSERVAGDLFSLNLLYSTTLTLRHKNVGGRAWELGGGLTHDNLISTPQDVLGDNALWNVGPFFNNPRFLNTYIQLYSSLTFEQSLSAQRDAYRQSGVGQVNLSYDFYNASFPSTWGKGLRLDLTLEGRLERRRALSVEDERRAFNPLTQSLTLSPRLMYDQRDNPLHPTRGFYASLTANGVLSLSAQAGAAGSFSFRETLTTQWVGSFFKRRLIIVPSLRLGALQSSLQDIDLPADFFFKAGGDGVPYPVRGYSDSSIEACRGVESEGACASVYALSDLQRSDPARIGGRALLNFNLEARFPTFAIDNLWGAVFSDLGAVSRDLSSMGADDMFPSVGAGLRYLFTGQIPLRLDLAYPLRTTPFDPSAKLRLHVNILYTL